ncbi:hypothetical protein [Sphingobacterium pedocola]|uniref:Uncharacterized protein n=1 Tax=Sphingobacterium pedocola TaxID=2082722 RepID=A0ABR9T3A1_9SPHI|nr:hypothetical protein [Sphingobacterium pedocola]MBE8719834.1 hypothetical protein [Sphingobacterium pedocola]
MEFDSKPYEGTEERLVRLTIEEESLWRCYRLTIPWEFKTEKGAPPVPSLYFEEWKKEGDILAESETLSHVRLELDKLFENNFFLIEQFPFELYTKIKKTELSHFCIMPRHIKQAVYLLIQQGKIVIRNKGGRYIFQQYK